MVLLHGPRKYFFYFFCLGCWMRTLQRFAKDDAIVCAMYSEVLKCWESECWMVWSSPSLRAGCYSSSCSDAAHYVRIQISVLQVPRLRHPATCARCLFFGSCRQPEPLEERETIWSPHTIKPSEEHCRFSPLFWHSQSTQRTPLFCLFRATELGWNKRATSLVFIFGFVFWCFGCWHSVNGLMQT